MRNLISSSYVFKCFDLATPQKQHQRCWPTRSTPRERASPQPAQLPSALPSSLFVGWLFQINALYTALCVSPPLPPDHPCTMPILVNFTLHLCFQLYLSEKRL